MKESLAEISSQRAEQFLNTFYFQYGHRSIADLAHIPFAIERLSLLAAIALVDETALGRPGALHPLPELPQIRLVHPRALARRRPPPTPPPSKPSSPPTTSVGAGMLDALKRAIPQPAGMDDGAYTRTLKARAFDVARYLLPLATNTSLGQIVSARTLETQISRLLSSEFAEVRTLGETPQVRRRRARLERPARTRPASSATKPSPHVRRTGLRTATPSRRHPAPRRQDRAHAGQVRRAQRLRHRLPHRTPRRRRRAHGRPAHRTRPRRRPRRRRRLARSRTRHLAPLPRMPLLLASAPAHRRRAPRRPRRRDSSPSAPNTAAATTSCPAPSPPARPSNSTSSWTSAASATCTAIAAASSSSSPTPTSTATTSPSAPASPPSPKPASTRPTPPPWTPPTPPTALPTRHRVPHS